MSKARPGSRDNRRASPHDLTESEWLIIKAVWEHEPCAAPTVQEALHEQTGWTYSTVKTLMHRMAEKGYLDTDRIRNLVLYRSTLTPAQARKGEVLRTLKRAFDGALTPMMQFLLDSDGLSDKDLAELEAQIKDKRHQISRRGKRG